MGLTTYFGLAFFDFGDELDAVINIRKEADRFLMIDKQIYGLYNVFGNGVIEGWSVADGGYTIEDGISITISPGIGIIKYMAAETAIADSINLLPVDTTVYIYATLTGSTVRNRAVDFIATTSELENNVAIKLAKVVTGDNSVLSVDNTVKEQVGFKAFIEEEVDNHKHRGTPSKIDLQIETKNQLPGARIEGVDASKIESGTFDINRIPILDHNELDNNGLLTHAALDSFVKTLSQNNKQLLGEVASVNLLRTIIFLKYMFPDVDEHFINELAIIPGISSNSLIDFDASTAYINLEDQCISGYPAKVGLFSSVYWDTQDSLSNNYASNNVVIAGGRVSLAKEGSNIDIVENFETLLPGGNLAFTKELTMTSEEINAVSMGYDVNKIEGSYSGKFSASAFTLSLRILTLSFPPAFIPFAIPEVLTGT